MANAADCVVDGKIGTGAMGRGEVRETLPAALAAGLERS